MKIIIFDKIHKLFFLIIILFGEINIFFFLI